MSLLYSVRNCIFCKNQFEYPNTSPRCLCAICAANKALLFECIKVQKDFLLIAGSLRFHPIYWAVYNVTNVSPSEFIIYLRDKDKTMYVGKIGSIFPKNAMMYSRPLPRCGEDKDKYLDNCHIVTWENILCVLRHSCA